MAGQPVTESVTFPSNGGQGMGYLARPDDGAAHPGVVVIQEWWGLEEHIKDVARRLAREGFVALAPDLYHGRVTGEPDEARKLAMGLDRDRAVKDLDGAVDFLCGMSQVAPKQVGMVGFCMGGGLTLLMACRNADLGAAAVFYGGNMGSPDLLRQLHCPLFGAFGERDEGIPLERVEALKEGLQQSGQPVEIRIYPGAPHAFFNDTRPSYRPEAAQDAWQRTLALFHERLR
ncbi:MAG TPA: dienelactone hydrolase family protein [Dehalococcoidia bacterium]|nr:dienelactone hydrolase family protein [Dehalococcoidia bacterium]